MRITKSSEAGKQEANDIFIWLEPNEKEEIEIKLESVVKLQFGKQIEKVIRETLAKLGVTSASVTAWDGGALDYAIRARVETAVRRAGEV